jgi:hypothetical protein
MIRVTLTDTIAINARSRSYWPETSLARASRRQTRTGPHQSVNAMTRCGVSCRNRFYIPVAQILSSERIKHAIVPDQGNC